MTSNPLSPKWHLFTHSFTWFMAVVKVKVCYCFVADIFKHIFIVLINFVGFCTVEKVKKSCILHSSAPSPFCVLLTLYAQTGFSLNFLWIYVLILLFNLYLSLDSFSYFPILPSVWWKTQTNELNQQDLRETGFPC